MEVVSTQRTLPCSSTLGQKASAICFICSRNKISQELSAAVLEMQGIPDTKEDKLNIIKVICQLLRVRWEVMGSLFSSHDGNLPFCVGCLKFIIEIISLREQLFQIETEIRDKIAHIETSVAQLMDPLSGSGIGMNDDELECELEPPESYEECRQLFQKEVMNEFLNKELLQKKIDEMDEASRGEKVHPSLIQLQFQKNVSNPTDTKQDISGLLKIPTEIGKDNNQVLFPSLSTTTSDLTTKENIDQLSFADEFRLDLVQIDDDLPNSPKEAGRGIGVRDDSDYGSPRKKIKMGSCAESIDNIEFKVEKKGIIDKNEESENESPTEEDSNDSFSGSEQSSSDGSGSDDEAPAPPTRKYTRKQADSPKNPKPSQKKAGRQPPKNAPAESTNKTVKRKLIFLKQEVATFLGKDGTTWTTQAPLQSRRTRAFNILREDGGLVGPAKNTQLSPVQLFKLMFPPSIIDTIVGHINRSAESAQGKGKWNPVTTDEFYGYVGILIYLGIEKKGTVSKDEIWRQERKYLIPCIIATMSKHRFASISQFTGFDSVAREGAQAEGIKPSKLGFICEIFQPFVNSLQAHFRPYDHVVVDEMLVDHKESVRFRGSTKSNPKQHTHGAKVWALCDSTTGYILRMAVYEGKLGDDVEKELGKKVVLGLVEKYFKSGRVVTADKYFTSKALGTELMKHNMGLLGTLNKSRMDVIPEFAEGNGKEIHSSTFAFQNDFTMMSYMQRKNKSVVLLSTEHHSAEINAEENNKPQMILDYNDAKGGVDARDQTIGKFSCQRPTIKWGLKLFHAMIDVGALNAYIIWKIHRGNEIKQTENRRHFLRSLSEGLMEPIIAERSKRGSLLPPHIKDAKGDMGYPVIAPPLPVPTIPDSEKGWGKCVLCPVRSRSSRSRCTQCRNFICNTHGVKIYHCLNCKFVPANQNPATNEDACTTDLFRVQSVNELPSSTPGLLL